LQSRAAREEALSDSIKKSESTLEVKVLELEKAHKYVDRVKEECHKKIQRLHDKVTKLEDQSRSKTAEFDTMKVDPLNPPTPQSTN
jgi:hypothetical protein